jgi:hypothetical protein
VHRRGLREHRVSRGNVLAERMNNQRDETRGIAFLNTPKHQHNCFFFILAPTQLFFFILAPTQLFFFVLAIPFHCGIRAFVAAVSNSR